MPGALKRHLQGFRHANVLVIYTGCFQKQGRLTLKSNLVSTMSEVNNHPTNDLAGFHFVNNIIDFT